MSHPRVALAMIVRDEAGMLPDFLQRVRGAYDELCVVDTGSTDGTLALLKAAGARVLEMPWRSDFAEARNASLGLVTADWVLVLDPDEWVSPAFPGALRALVTDETVGAATVLMENPLPSGHLRRSRLLRAFRRTHSIVFEHPIHEDPSASVFAMLSARGLRLGHVHPPITHHGYTRQYASARGKLTRDRQMLEAQLSRDPTDWYAHFKLLELARFWEDRRLGASAALALKAQLEKVGPEALRSLHFAGEMLGMMAERACSTAEQALRLVDRLGAKAPPSAALELQRAQWHEQMGNRAQAAQSFERCLALDSGFGDLQVTRVRPLLGLARVAMDEGNLARARELVDVALHEQPRDREALLAAAVLSRLAGGAEAVAAWAQAWRARDIPELDEALGDEAFLHGDLDAAAHHFRQARQHAHSVDATLRLAQVLFAAGRTGEAEALADGILGQRPAAALGVVLCRLLRGVDSQVELPLEHAEAGAALRQWLDGLFLFGPAPLREEMLRCVPALFGAFPWLRGYVQAFQRQVGLRVVEPVKAG